MWQLPRQWHLACLDMPPDVMSRSIKVLVSIRTDTGNPLDRACLSWLALPRSGAAEVPGVATVLAWARLLAPSG